MAALLTRSQIYEESENVGRNPSANATIGDVIAARYDGAARNAVGIRRGAISGNMKVSFQAARSIG